MSSLPSNRMKTAALAGNIKDRGVDFYETPKCCVTSAFDKGVFEGVNGSIWEPCAGRGAISRVFIEKGFDVVAEDLCAYEGADEYIESGIDFFFTQTAPFGCECIITNPPFMYANDFIRHALRLVPRCIVFLRAMYIEGKSRSDLIDNHLYKHWVGINRPPIMHRDNYEGVKIKSGAVQFAWFDFRREPKESNFIETRRIYWRNI